MFNFEDYLTEDSKRSITRAAFVWLMVNGVFMGWWVLIFGSLYVVEATGLIVAVTSVATGLKLYQKGQEIKSKNDQMKIENEQ